MADNDLGKEELRIALVMNGGVSLAVWIGGVVREVARLLSGSSAYGQLAELLAIDPRVDVIAGTSAGGVNGAYLAMAMAYHDRADSLDQAAAGLRNLWVDNGAIEMLLRSPLEKTPPSLLDGDGFYYDTLLAALQDLKGEDATDAAAVPVDLILTATLLKGSGKHYADDYGSPVVDVSHRAHFRFRRNADGDQFTKPSSAAQLALAARTTSSFPGAFEPSFCPVGADDGDRPDMAAVAHGFEKSRFLIDGGILDNKPLDVALASIFEQRATRPTRRVLAYIVPAPEGTAASRNVPETRADDPGLLKVVLSSLVEIPSVQSISAQLEALREHNKAVREKRRSRIVITRCNSPAEIDALAGTLFEAYRDMRVTRALDYVIGEINEGLLVEAGSAPFGRRGRREWLCGTLSALKGELPWIPAAPPLAAAATAAADRSAAGWSWGARPVEHFAQFLLDLVVRVQRLAATRRAPPDLVHYWTAAFDAIERSKHLRSDDRNYWRAQATKVVEALGTGLETRTPAAGAQKWFKKSFLEWATKVKPSGELAAKIAEDVRQLAPIAFALADEAANSADQALARDVADLRHLFAYFVRKPDDPADLVLARLLAFEVVQEALGAEGEDLEEEVDFIQISGDDDVADGSGRKAEDKLNGVQLAHFGAFYKRSWRANDWLWGRRDAVRRLVRLLIEPARLKTIARRRDPPLKAAGMADVLLEIARGYANPADASWAGMPRPTAAKIAAELSYVDDDSIPVPERLPQTTDAIARRLELEILCAELPALASAIEADGKAGLATSIAIGAFATDCAAAARSGDWLTATAAAALGPRCSLGGERLQAEVGTDPATRTIAQALAVSVAAVGGDKRISASLGGAIAFLRAPTLVFYAFARNLALRSRTGLVINAALAAAAAVIVGTAMALATNPYPTWVVAAAGGVLAACGFLLLSRLGPLLRWLVAALVLVAVILVLFFGLADMDKAAWRMTALVEGGLIGSLLLGRFLLRSRKPGRPAGADGGT